MQKATANMGTTNITCHWSIFKFDETLCKLFLQFHSKITEDSGNRKPLEINITKSYSKHYVLQMQWEKLILPATQENVGGLLLYAISRPVGQHSEILSLKN